jgi:hypothetical protein
MAYHGHFFAASFALLAIFVEVLMVTLAGIPYSPGQILTEFFVCSYTSMIVLVLMMLGMVALMLWRRKAPDLPRVPDTLLGVMSYVADSKMLDNFEGLEMMEKKDADNKIGGLGRRYGYGRFVGADGQVKWMVDEESNFVS